MAAMSRNLLTLGASLMTAWTSFRMRRVSGAADRQERTRARLVRDLARTSFWRESGIEPGLNHAQFKKRVPLRSYDDFTEPIGRMKRGEADVLWPGRCSMYANSSGTSGGRAKCLPVTTRMLEHFENAGLQSLFAYTARVGHVGVFRGRHLFLGGSSALATIAESKPFQAYAGDLSGITALTIPKWAERLLHEPGAEIAQMEDWPAKVQAIAHRTATLDITLLGGLPSWALFVADALRAQNTHAKVRIPNLQALWPNFECFVHGGVPIAPFQEELRTVLGPTVQFHEVYPASEAFVAVQDAESGAGLRLLTDAGVYFEFLPMAVFDEAKLPTLGEKTVTLADVQTGVDYALVVTTPAGLARYVLGDVVRFTSTSPARIVYVGGTKLQLAAFGEQVTERQVTESLCIICRRNGWTIVNFHVAPLLAASTIGRGRGRHEFWIELRPGTSTTPKAPHIEAELDAELRRMNGTYDAKRRAGAMEAPVVRLVMTGVFEHWMKHHGKWGGQNKMPRCRSDRRVADELAHMQHFAGN
jgi:hypothetical protein